MFLVIYIPVVSVVPIACVQTPPPPSPSVDKTLLDLQNSFCPTQPHSITANYYIKTNEIPEELSRENLVSSHVKISPLLWLHNKSRLSHQKTIKVKWFDSSWMSI